MAGWLDPTAGRGDHRVRDATAMDEGFPARLERAARGDARALEELFALELPGLRAYLRLRSGRLLRAKESVSDLVQSVCREVLQDLPTFRPESEAAFRGWLYTSAQRKLADRRRYWDAERRDASRESGLDVADLDDADDGLLARYRSFASPSGHAAVREEVARIEAAFAELPEGYREVIALHKLAGLSHRAIAERTGSTEEAVRQRLARALARLARLLDPGRGT
jgi:RNA polymerase sigma-70 factor (ECF subfamily)